MTTYAPPDGALCIEATCVRAATVLRTGTPWLTRDGVLTACDEWVCSVHAPSRFTTDVGEVPWHKLSDVEALALRRFHSDSLVARFHLCDPASNAPPLEATADDIAIDLGPFRARRAAFVQTVGDSLREALEGLLLGGEAA